MSLKYKIFLLGMLPLLCFILSGFYMASDSYKVYVNSQLVSSNMEYTRVLTQLINETQKERGASAGYLSGGITLEKLETQRGLTNKFHKEGLTGLKKVLFPKSYKDELKTAFNKYSKLRDQVTSKKITTAQAVKRYSEIIALWIGYDSKIANQTIFGNITSANKTLQSLEFIKEFSGKLRATTTSLISKDAALTNDQLAKLQSLMYGVSVSIDSKALTFSDKALELKNDFLHSSEWIKAQEFYNTILEKQSEGNFGINASTNFQTISAAISKLNKLIQYQLNETIDIVNTKKSDSISGLIFLSSLLSIISLIIIFVVIKISKDLISGLMSINERISGGIAQITSLANEVSDTSRSLSVASEEQASSVHETSSSMQEIEAMIKRNTDDAKKSNEIVGESYQEVTVGSEKIKQMTGAMNNISGSNDKVTEQVAKSNDKMNEIAGIIKRIGDKTQVINDIVFQTKLLSFNASVEAARAGEHGKGFAVVAEEIGNLAQMSGTAAKEISEMLESSISSVEKVAVDQEKEMKSLILESKDNITQGMQLGRESEEFLTGLMKKMDTLKTSVAQITLASDEQLKGVNEIASAIQELNDTTRMNSDIASNSSRISESLGHNITSFNIVVNDLESLITSKGSTQAIKSSPKKSKTEAKKVALAPISTEPENVVLDFDDKNFEDIA